MDSKQKGIVILAVVVVVIAAVFAAQALDDKHNEASCDTYYFYLDGMDSNNGWYSADGEDAGAAFLKVMESTGLTVSISDKGWLTISEYPSTYDKATSSGKGISIYEYISKDVSQPNASYFATGPVMPDVTGNILYLVYSNYSFDANYNTINEINPTVSTAWQTTGPFAVGSDYEPISYETYYFYLDGMEGKNGWYSAKGDNAAEAFVDVGKQAGLTVTISDKGWLTISEYPSTYDKATSSGKGISIYEYISKDVSQPNASYFATGPVMPDVTGNILYLVYSNYSFDANYNTINEINPTVSTAWQTTGPFAA